MCLSKSSQLCSIFVLGRFGAFREKYHEKNEVEHVIGSIMVPSCFCGIHGKGITDAHEYLQACV